MISPRDNNLSERIDWWRHLKTFSEGVGATAGGAVAAGIAVLALDMIYFRATGKSPNFGPLAEPSAYAGALCGFATWFAARAKEHAAANASHFLPYVTGMVKGAALGFSLIIVLMVLGSFGGEFRREYVSGTFFLATCLGALVAFLAPCRLAYERREFLPLAVVGVAILGIIEGSILLALAATIWRASHHLPMPESEKSISLIVGAILGAAYELWRHFAKIRGWSTVGVLGVAVAAIANVASRSKLLVVGLWWTVVGGFVLTVTWVAAFQELQPDEATTRWIILVGGGAVGMYWLFARGLGPAWSAISSPTKLTEDDLVHGRATLADEDRAVKAAGGRRG